MTSHAHTCVFIALAASAIGCAISTQVPDRSALADALRNRTGRAIRNQSGPPSLPPDVSLADGMTTDEAVAIALWNSPAFEATLTDLIWNDPVKSA